MINEIADEYGIVMGSSHHEPLLCNTLYDWSVTAQELGMGGPWNYAKSAKQGSRNGDKPQRENQLNY